MRVSDALARQAQREARAALAVVEVSVPPLASARLRETARPRPMPRALVVNSGSKILAAQIRRDAGPVVLDVEPHVPVGDAAADADGAAAALERLDGVDQQVEEDLADLDRVDADPRQARRARRRCSETPAGTLRRACCAATTSATATTSRRGGRMREKSSRSPTIFSARPICARRMPRYSCTSAARRAGSSRGSRRRWSSRRAGCAARGRRRWRAGRASPASRAAPAAPASRAAAPPPFRARRSAP